MVNIMGQFNWTPGCPDIWLNMIEGVSVRVFLKRLAFESVDGAKQMTLLSMGGSHQSGSPKGLNRTKRLTKRELLLTA